MAIGRLSVKVGKVGKAAPHAAYIAREAPYRHRLHTGEELEATETGNLPAWAAHCPNLFWQASDLYERRNGTTYRELEIALPRELTPEQRLALVRTFIQQELGDRHAYQWAIHNPKALDGGEQPHVHLMFSERRCDGIARDPNQYFKRYNAKQPEKGGARKGYGPHAGKTLSRAERAAELKALRERWAVACNTALEQAGCSARIDMRSHAERGLAIAPERKQLPSAWRQPERRAEVIAFREARAEQIQAQAALAELIPDPGAEIIQLEAERQRRIEAAEAQRLAELRERQAAEEAERVAAAQRLAAQQRAAAERQAAIQQALDNVQRAFDAWLERQGYQKYADFQRTADESWIGHKLRVLPILRRIVVRRLSPVSLPDEAIKPLVERCYAGLKARLVQDAQQAQAAKAAAEQRALEEAAALVVNGPRLLSAEFLAFFRAVKEQAVNEAQAAQWIVETIQNWLQQMLVKAGHTEMPAAEPLAVVARQCYAPIMSRVAEREAQLQAEQAHEAEQQAREAKAAEEDAARQAQEAAAAEAERQRLLLVNIDALEQNRRQWAAELADLRQASLPDAAALASQWAGLAKAQANQQRAAQAFEDLQDAFVEWHGSAAGWFGLNRSGRRDWEARLQQAEAALNQADQTLEVAQRQAEERLPEARQAVQRQVAQRQQRAVVLEQQIKESGELIVRATQARLEAWGQGVSPVPYPKPKYPAPGG